MLSKQVRKCINRKEKKNAGAFSPFCTENHYSLQNKFNGHNDTYFVSDAQDACKQIKKFMSSTTA